MDFSWSDPAVEIRRQARRFLETHLPDEMADAVYRSGVFHDAGFARALAQRGWLPRGSGDRQGDALDLETAFALEDELSKAESPTYALATTMMVVRVLAATGSSELKTQIIPAAVAGESTIALGLSEPEAGSDVAAVRTRARRDGGEWVIDGQKMFTTNGHVTDYVFLLARTNPDVANHRGLTTFLMPLDTPGIQAQAVYTLSGERTNIMYYDGVRLDDRWRIGAVDDGWGVLMIFLQDEHSAGFSAHLARLLEETEAWARTPVPGGHEAEPVPGGATLPIEDPEVQERLARAAADLEVSQLLEQRAMWLTSIGEVPVAEGPMAKLFGTEALVRQAEELNELVGPDALRSRLDPTALRRGLIEHALRFSLGTTIYAGTSEIQRNIIAQRACGLPR